MADEPALGGSRGGSHQSVKAQISTGMVQLVREYTGRGPTKARTYIEDDLVTCVLEDTLTKGERVLVEHNLQMVLDQRRAFQGAMSSDARKLVEESTGRSVIAFMSDNHVPRHGRRVLHPRASLVRR